MVRMMRLTCDCTALAEVASGATTDSAPMRSPYSENDLEYELATTKLSMPASAMMRTAAPSSLMPLSKPW
ncbi:hypothetical protein D3C71_1749300 [compost metagenome]